MGQPLAAPHQSPYVTAVGLTLGDGLTLDCGVVAGRQLSAFGEGGPALPLPVQAASMTVVIATATIIEPRPG